MIASFAKRENRETRNRRPANGKIAKGVFMKLSVLPSFAAQHELPLWVINRKAQPEHFSSASRCDSGRRPAARDAALAWSRLSATPPFEP
jgi:hypothetical protein